MTAGLMYPTKRRRVDATSTLTKPFRSPLIVTPKERKHSSEEHDDLKQKQPTTNASTHLAAAAAIAAPGTAQFSNVSEATPSQDRLHQQEDVPGETTSSPIRSTTLSPGLKHNVHRSYATDTLLSPHRPPRPVRRSLYQDPEYLSLQRTHSSLNAQLKDLSNRTDTTTQALQRLNSTQSAELIGLIQQWRRISRDAAEELFVTAKDRVNRMGGVGVFREKCSKHRNNDFGGGFADEDDDEQIDEDELSEEQREQLDIVREEKRKALEWYGRRTEGETQGGKVEKDDDSFTMDMMLKQLNIDLEVIGYDEHAQRWAD